MSRTKLIAGNWKMNTTLDEAKVLAEELMVASPPSGVEIAVFPPYPWLVPVRDRLGGSPILTGAQNCYIRASGAFTGEVSAMMLADVCNMVLAGHSERRLILGESDEVVGEKVAAILRAGLRAVICVGETLEQREANEANVVVERQLEAALSGVTPSEFAFVVVAYEPVWAIGTGVAATAEDAQQMCGFIRTRLGERFGAAGSETVILYGGSVTPDNAAVLFNQPDIDGGLVGGASLNAKSFLAIVAAAAA